jgi:hypothetical protein
LLAIHAARQRDAYSDCDGNADSYSHSEGNGYGNCDTEAEAVSDAGATSDSLALVQKALKN